MAEAVRKIRKPSIAAQRLKAPALNEGDTVDYGLTVEVKHPRKGSFWPKMAATSTVRPGETGDAAMDRVMEFVARHLDQQIIDILGN